MLVEEQEHRENSEGKDIMYGGREKHISFNVSVSDDGAYWSQFSLGGADVFGSSREKMQTWGKIIYFRKAAAFRGLFGIEY